MTKIKLTTSGLPVGERTTARVPDIDHARDIVEYTARGYTIAAVDTDKVWRVIFTGATGLMLARTYFHTEDARLLDREVPEWTYQLVDWVAKLLPPDRSIANRPKEQHDG